MSVSRDNPFIPGPRLALALAAAVAALGLAFAAWWPGGGVMKAAAVDTPAAIDGRAAQSSVEALARRLESPPAGQPAPRSEDWALLARSYAALGRPREAERAFGRASELAPRDAQLLAERAEAVLAAGGPDASTRAGNLAAQALAIEPLQPRALALGLDLQAKPAKQR